MYIIGIDGGGTKTEAILFHINRGKLTSIVGEASNPHSTSFERSTDIVIRIIQQLLESSYLSNEGNVYISIGIAGLGRIDDKQKWTSLFNEKITFSSNVKRVEIE